MFLRCVFRMHSSILLILIINAQKRIYLKTICCHCFSSKKEFYALTIEWRSALCFAGQDIFIAISNQLSMNETWFDDLRFLTQPNKYSILIQSINSFVSWSLNLLKFTFCDICAFRSSSNRFITLILLKTSWGIAWSRPRYSSKPLPTVKYILPN